MEITATELKMNLGKYIDRSRIEDIWIKKNGKTVAKLVGTSVSSEDAISGILASSSDDNMNRHSIREERLAKHEMHD